MANLQCLICGKVFKGEAGRGGHMARTHGDLPTFQAVHPGFVRCSPAALQFIAQVEVKTGMTTEESLDLLVGCAIDDELLTATLDIWEPLKSGAENAPFWLPSRVPDYEGKIIKL